MDADNPKSVLQREFAVRRSGQKWNSWPTEMRPKWLSTVAKGINERKVSEEAVASLDRCIATNRPFSELGMILEERKRDPQWTAAEVKELWQRVVRELMNRS